MHSPGTLIGSYRLVRLLGEGAMGAVYEAEHTLLERRAAIKILHSDLIEQRSSVQRFLNEARAMSRVHHPGLVEVRELGELPDSGPYLVMELLIGETLSACSARTKRFSPALALDVTRQIADAMTAAHAQGIVHRDLKPSNVMLIAAAESPEFSRIKVLDFGIAKLTPSSRTGREADSLTRSQAVLGTAEYMAPEQCRDARGVDAQADVYALGVILYELLAGQRPFAAATPLEVMLLHMQAMPPLLKTYCPELGDELLALVHQMLAKAPDERPTMAAVAQRLSSELLVRGPRQAGTADEPWPAKGMLDGIHLVSKTGASKQLRRRQVLWAMLGLGGLAPVFVGARRLLSSHKPPPEQTAIHAAQAAATRPSPPPASAPPLQKASEAKAEAGPPRAPHLKQKPETLPPKEPQRPANRLPVAPSPPVLFKNKDPDGL